MDDHLRVEEGASSIRIIASRDALGVVWMPASQEFDHRVPHQCIKAYDAGLVQHCRKLLPSVNKHRHVHGDPTVDTEYEFEMASLL